DKIPEALGDRRIPVGYDRIDTPAVFFGMRIFQNDAHGKQGIDLFKGFLLTLHLSKDGINMLGPAFYFELKSLIAEFISDGLHEFFDESFSRFSLLTQLTGNELVRVRIYYFETEIFQFTLNVK